MEKPIKEIIEDLSKPIADRHLKSRKQGGVDLAYISWETAIKYLDLYAPGWCYEIPKIHTDANRLYVTARITIPAAEGLVHREATGTEILDTNSYGDPSSNAESMALKRAAAKFGLALYLYEKSPGVNSGNSNNSSGSSYNNNVTVADITNPIASSMSDQISAKQLGMVRAIAREVGVDPDEECKRILNCSSDELSKKAASAFIQHLQDMQKGQETPMRRAA